MSVLYNPKVVTDSLVLYYDFANIRSFNPSDSSNLYDLCKTENATIFNSPTHSTANQGIMDFDVGDQWRSNFNSFPTSYSMEAWFNMDTFNNTYNVFAGFQTPAITFRSNSRIYFTGRFGGSLRDITSAGTYSTGVWYHCVCICEFNDPDSILYLYINGVLENQEAITGSHDSAGASALVLGAWRTSGTYPFDGKLGLFKFYNKVLTPQEVKQNFNATRGRFGV